MHTINPTELLVMKNKEKNKRRILDHESREKSSRQTDLTHPYLLSSYSLPLFLLDKRKEDMTIKKEFSDDDDEYDEE